MRLIVPYPPGGGADTLGRAVAQKLAEALGQSVIADNRAGAGGNIGTGLAAKSPSDGHTLLLATLGPMAINPSLHEKLPYDSVRDFAHITQLANVPGIVVVHPSLPVRNVRELIAFAKSNPSVGIGRLPPAAFMRISTRPRRSHAARASRSDVVTQSAGSA